jgi:DNA repair exonuclease SbcCD ATPase subunit
METIARRLEADRASIEADRKKLNADCPRVAESDTAKRNDCRARQEDVLRRMDRFKRELARWKALREAPAACKELAEMLARWELGAKRAAEVIAKNDAMMRQAEADRQHSVDEAVNATASLGADLAVDQLNKRLVSFLQERQNLEAMKRGLDDWQKFRGTRKHAYPLGDRQMEKAKLFVDRGVEAAADVTDLGVKVNDAIKATGGYKNLNPALLQQFNQAVARFTHNFLEDQEGWETLGQITAFGAPGLQKGFVGAVYGIKMTAAGIGMHIANRDMGVFRANQEATGNELKELQQKIRDIRSEMAMRRCP